MTAGVDTATSVLPLFAWLSPAFPVGAFAYSHGLEAAADAGLIRDAATLEDWLGALLRHGSGRQDALLAAEAWRCAESSDAAALCALNDLALALAPSRERRLETGQTGRAFAEAIHAAWPAAAAAAIASILATGDDVAYPVAFGAAAGTAGMPLGPCLEGLLLGFAANLVSAAVRLGIVGQTGGQRVIAALLPEARSLGASLEGATLDDLGACALRSDIATLDHETLYSRLFRS